MTRRSENDVCRCALCLALIEAARRAELAMQDRRRAAKMSVVDGGKGSRAA
jgi:hypothetical protein